ncbi:MAG TPA: hypothetical protein VN980_18235 [Alphaproteobacteria bacterium]|nr:hypothetical protein [Alphaproteobacteria bacterium]
MSAFLKVIVGDRGNLAVVAFAVALAAALVEAGFVTAAALVVPLVLLAGVRWLAAR